MAQLDIKAASAEAQGVQVPREASEVWHSEELRAWEGVRSCRSLLPSDDDVGRTTSDAATYDSR